MLDAGLGCKTRAFRSMLKRSTLNWIPPSLAPLDLGIQPEDRFSWVEHTGLRNKRLEPASGNSTALRAEVRSMVPAAGPKREAGFPGRAGRSIDRTCGPTTGGHCHRDRSRRRMAKFAMQIRMPGVILRPEC